MGRLLIHSLAFYAELIEQLAQIPQNPHIVEVGSEAGEMSERLAAIAAARSGSLYVLEPCPSQRLRDLAARSENVVVIEAPSPGGLQQAPPAGLYVIDGDHNYAVVRAELETVFGASAQEPLAVLHDIGWPWARRDLYYAPEQLQSEDVHPHSFDRGVVLDSVELAAPGRGFRSLGAYAAAVTEGGPRNGVLTAVEDVLAARPDLALLSTPLIFGLGVVGATTSASWSRVVDIMRPYTDNPTLEMMERNRLALYLEVLRLQDERPRARASRVTHRLLRNQRRRLVRPR